MALADFPSLQTSIAAWLRRTDLTAQIPDFITIAEANMNRILRTSKQLVSQPFTITGEFVNLPTEFRMLRSLRLQSGTWRPLRQITPEQMNKRKAVPAIILMEPREFTAVGAQLEFWPVPDRTYPGLMDFQLQIPPLSVAFPTNWVIIDHPDCYLFGALAAGYAFLKNDERAAALQGQFVRAMAEMQAALRTSYDRTLRIDAGLLPRSNLSFNWISGDTV
jgi:hypothetical protein